MYAALAHYRRINGHCLVSTLSKTDYDLGAWVHTQRSQRKQGKLREDHIRRLDVLGFVWDLPQEQWDRRFAALVEYKKRFGTCDVPWNWHDAELMRWVKKQQEECRRGKLAPERARRLAELGCRWCRQ
jgi:hypothetical protein